MKEEALAAERLEVREPMRGEAKVPTANVQTWGGVEFVRIPAGKFLMGSKDENALASDAEKPQHTVEIAYDYWLARYPTTNEQFARFVEAAHRPIALDKNWSSKADHPVVNVNWREALEYCNWLQSVIGKDLPANAGRVRLPTEAEWEKAARGAGKRIYPWGNSFNNNFANTTEAGIGQPVAVASRSAQSPYGVFDAIGNVWEHVQDWYGGGYYAESPKANPRGPAAGPFKVIRGGSFKTQPDRATTTTREQISPDSRGDDVGFRCVKDAK